MTVLTRRTICFVTAPIDMHNSTTRMVKICNKMHIPIDEEKHAVLFTSSNHKIFRLLWIDEGISYTLDCRNLKPFTKFKTVLIRDAEKSPIVTLTYTELLKLLRGHSIQSKRTSLFDALS